MIKGKYIPLAILYLLGRIRNILVPQTGHSPFIAFLFPRLLFISTSFAFFISLLALHLTQYASMIIKLKIKTVDNDDLSLLFSDFTSKFS